MTDFVTVAAAYLILTGQVASAPPQPAEAIGAINCVDMNPHPVSHEPHKNHLVVRWNRPAHHHHRGRHGHR